MEVYHSNIWGTVCDDLWSLADACKQLGYPTALVQVGLVHTVKALTCQCLLNFSF